MLARNWFEEMAANTSEHGSIRIQSEVWRFSSKMTSRKVPYSLNPFSITTLLPGYAGGERNIAYSDRNGNYSFCNLLKGFLLWWIAAYYSNECWSRSRAFSFQTKSARQIPSSAFGAKDCKMTMIFLRIKFNFNLSSYVWVKVEDLTHSLT